MNITSMTIVILSIITSVTIIGLSIITSVTLPRILFIDHKTIKLFINSEWFGIFHLNFRNRMFGAQFYPRIYGQYK